MAAFDSSVWQRSRGVLLGWVTTAVVLAGCASAGHPRNAAPAPPRPGTTSSPAPGSTSRPGPASAASGPVPLFAHYYLWWDTAHWGARLGAAATSDRLRLPATLATDGCTATPSSPGDTLIDVPSPSLGLYSEDDVATLTAQVEEAAREGINGFVVSWSGTGAVNQTSSGRAFNRRLALLVGVVHAYNRDHPTKFALMLGYEGLDNQRRPRPAAWVRNDLSYFVRTYGTDPAFSVPRYGSKPVVMFLDSRRFGVAELHQILVPYRSRLTLVGDEHGLAEWNRGVSDVFDGDGWYWSEEDPYSNARAFTVLVALAGRLHSQHKLWFSPLSGGYNKSSFGIGGKCVPRRGGQTLRLLYAGNKRSNPDGWMLISWNEYYENTYAEPSLRYGTQTLDLLRHLRATG